MADFFLDFRDIFVTVLEVDLLDGDSFAGDTIESLEDDAKVTLAEFLE